MERDIKIPRLIGLSGKAQVGKDTAARYIKDRLYQIISSETLCYDPYAIRIKGFAHNLKKVVELAFGFTAQQVFSDLKLVKDEYWGITPSEAAQIVGTECFRDVIDTDFWIKSFFNSSDIKAADYVIVPDVRFENEAKAIEDRDGLLIRINRKDRPDTGRPDTHRSETALDDYPFKYVVNNDGTLKDLHDQIDTIINNF